MSSRSACRICASAGMRSPATRSNKSSISIGRPASDRHSAWQQGAQSFGSPIGLALLAERECRVDHDDHEDRHTEFRKLGEERQTSGDPQHQREEMQQLLGKSTRAGWKLRCGKSIGPVAGTPCRGLVEGKAGRGDPDGLRHVNDGRPERAVRPGSDVPMSPIGPCRRGPEGPRNSTPHASLLSMSRSDWSCARLI